MKLKAAIVTSIIGLLFFVGACRAGFIHPSFQGEFCAHGHKYVANTDGTIVVQRYHEATSYVQSNSGYVSDGGWYTEMTLDNLENLDAVIGDLQKMSKQLHDAYGKDYKPDGKGCGKDC